MIKKQSGKFKKNVCKAQLFTTTTTTTTTIRVVSAGKTFDAHVDLLRIFSKNLQNHPEINKI